MLIPPSDIFKLNWSDIITYNKSNPELMPYADEDVVTIEKVGVFSRLINNHPAAVTFGTLTVLIVISCVVVFLVFLKRRQMNKYEKY